MAIFLSDAPEKTLEFGKGKPQRFRLRAVFKAVTIKMVKFTKIVVHISVSRDL